MHMQANSDRPNSVEKKAIGEERMLLQITNPKATKSSTKLLYLAILTISMTS